MTNLAPWLVGVFVLAASGVGLWTIFSRRGSDHFGDPYLEALECWIDGNLVGAEKLLRLAVRNDPNSIDPFLQLGNLMRIQGDPERAAVLHRGLTVRDDIPVGKKILIGLSLAEDFLALSQWDDARQTLDTISVGSVSNPRYWMGRFSQYYGMGNLPDAARTLKHSLKKVPAQDRPLFESAYTSFQLDRALESALAGDPAAVNPRLKDVAKFSAAAPRANLVRALLAASQGDAASALSIGAENLMDNQPELSVYLPILQKALLESGQYARSIPLLESACQVETAPPSLWVDLALLYEKLGQRDKSMRLLESKAGRSDFTPDVAAPILRKLFSEAPESDMARVWEWLSMPAKGNFWICRECGMASERVRWFCPQCQGFDSYYPQDSQGEVS